MAAHLHDSVLQTLALIQRTDDPKRVVTLARGQERELRDWLYRESEDDSADDLSTAIRDQASRVEATHDLPIEIVIVGDDASMSDGLHALARAAGEAMTNAAKHSGAEKVSVYVEVTDRRVQVNVLDTGVGFDPGAERDQGRGIPDSIVARMERHGGSASITSSRGEGTEVRLEMAKG